MAAKTWLSMAKTRPHERGSAGFILVSPITEYPLYGGACISRLWKATSAVSEQQNEVTFSLSLSALSLGPCLTLCLSVPVCFWVCLSHGLSLSLSESLSVPVYLRLSFCLSLCHSACVCRSVYLSSPVTLFRSVCLSRCMKNSPTLTRIEPAINLSQ